MDSYKPQGWPAVTPRLITADVAGLVEFLKRVFGATGEVQAGRPAEMAIADSRILVSDGAGVRSATSAFLYVYVPDVDEVWRRAVEAGATTIEAPAGTPYGDRRAMLEDRWGNTWQVATRSNPA
jgi:uncharacterized glyoxalase superfamily protein PhnB